MGFKKVIEHFDGILFWAATVIRMAAMIKLRHQQPSLWHRGLAERRVPAAVGNLVRDARPS
jgi:hypothetical protein